MSLFTSCMYVVRIHSICWESKFNTNACIPYVFLWFICLLIFIWNITMKFLSPMCCQYKCVPIFPFFRIQLVLQSTIHFEIYQSICRKCTSFTSRISNRQLNLRLLHAFQNYCSNMYQSNELKGDKIFG